MKVKLFLAAMTALVVAACASAPRGPAPLDPVGRYEFTTTFQGQTVTGAVLIGGSPGAYTGQITTNITEPLPVTGVAVNGQEMVVTASTPDGDLTIRMNFTDANAFTGGWQMPGDSGTLTGTRVG